MTKRTFWDRIMTAVKAQDAEAVKAELAEANSGDAVKTGDALAIGELVAAVKSLTADMAAMRASMAKPKGKTKDGDDMPPKKKDDDEETTDSDEDDEEEAKKKKSEDEILEAEAAASDPAAVGTVLSGDSLKTVIARAEILAPGLTVPTGDSLKSKVADALKTKALTQAYSTADGKAAIDPFLAGRKIGSLTGDALASVFTGSAELMRATNNRQAARSSSATRDFGKVTAVAEINANNKAFWANRK